ncbi:MAG: GNAT family N-acetyltransferase [Pseudomonadota bacterium]
MIKESKIILRAMQPVDRPAVETLSVSQDQLAFVEPTAIALEANRDAWTDHVVEVDGRIVGFFQIDARESGPRLPHHIEIHEVNIDAAVQGKGYGKALFRALPAYLRDAFPAATAACLTVNCRNPRAYSVYLAGGFVDTGALYEGGRSGPQHIMTLALRVASNVK